MLSRACWGRFRAYAADMTIRRKAAAGAVGILAAVALTGCGADGSSATTSWCDRGNRLYVYDDPNTGANLDIVPEATSCPGNDRQNVTVRPEGDTQPMPKVTAMQEGPYKPYKPSPRPSPNSSFRLTPQAH